MIKLVLIVDDEEEIVSFMGKFLKRFKIRSMKATSGEEAIRIYDKETIGAVFLDIRMGDMDGFEVLKQLKVLDPASKIIMITGCTDKESQEKAALLGALDYITKPLDLCELKNKVEKHLLTAAI